MAGLTGLTLLPGAGGAVLGVDSDGTYVYEIVKIGYSVAGATPVEVSASTPLPVTIVAPLVLPGGAATSALQTALNTLLGTPMQQTGGAVSVTNLPATQPVSAASLPLPANAVQETGGNLAAVASLLTFMQQLVELNMKMLAVLSAIRLQDASAFGVSVEPDDTIPDPTFN